MKRHSTFHVVFVTYGCHDGPRYYSVFNSGSRSCLPKPYWAWIFLKVIFAISHIVGGVLPSPFNSSAMSTKFIRWWSAKVEEKLRKKLHSAPKEIHQEIIASPFIGNVVPLGSSTRPSLLASGAMGKGIAIDPTDGVVVAPAKATEHSIFPYRPCYWFDN